MSQFNPNFSIDSYYNPKNPFLSILLAAGVPAIHAEMNEFQYIAGGKIESLYDDCLTDGIFEEGSINYENNVLTISDVRIKFQGHIYIVKDVAIICYEGDVIYFRVWEQVLTGLDVIREYGYAEGAPLPNNIYYPGFNPPAETSRRKAMYYDFSTDPPTPPQIGLEFGRIKDGKFVRIIPGVKQRLGMKYPFGWLVDGPVDYTTVIEGYPEYNDGQVYGFIIASEDCLDSPTVNVNGVGPVFLQTVDGLNMKAGDLLRENPYLFMYVDNLDGTPSFRMIGTAAKSDQPVRHHTHSSNDLPIRTNSFTLTAGGWVAQTPAIGPFAGRTVYVQYIGLPTSLGIENPGEVMGAYFEVDPSNTVVSSLLNYVAVADRWMIFHASEMPTAAVVVHQVQIIGGSVGTFTNPGTAPTTYPSVLNGSGMGNLGGVPWFGKFFSKVPNTNGAIYEGAVAPTGTTRLNYSGYFYATRFYNSYYSDFAEAFNVVENCEPGDVIMLHPENDDEYVLAHEADGGNTVIGVVSDQYAHLIGVDKTRDSNVPVGLAGKVPVKVEGPVAKGDLLVASFTPGVARVLQANESPFGRIIGKALEKSDESEVKLVTMLIMLS